MFKKFIFPKKRAAVFLTAALIFSNIFTYSPLCANAAEIDYKAEAEARKSLAVESNQIENWPSGPLLGAQSAILMEANTGTILYSKNIHDQLYPASTTKILTCLIAAEKASMNDMVTYSKEAVFSVKRDESNMGMDAGESITVEQTLYGVLVGSANEAANAIAEHISGSMEAFAALMNEKAKELGCENSNFVTTNGCFDENHYTSAYDLAVIAREFFNNELLCKMSNTANYEIPITATQPDDIWVHSKNQLLPGKQYAYDGLVGSKTGFTSEARQTLVSCAERDGLKLICVIMKEESPNQFTDTVELFDYGFNNFQAVNISENEKDYSINNDNFFNSDSDIFGNSKPILSLNENDYIVIPKTAVFEDVTSSLSYDNLDKNSVAQISYTYNGIDVGKVSVDLAVSEEPVFDFENPSIDEITEAEQEEDTDIIFVNIKKVLLIIVGIAVLLILLVVIRAVIMNYQFARKRSSKLRRKKRRRIHSEFDDYDF